MKFSEKWLREWVNPNLNTNELGNLLTMAGLELEGSAPAAGAFNNVVIGKIQQAEQHPNADRLRVCQVDVGRETLLNIVCGAPNARAGIKVAVAMIGAVLPNGFTIKKAKLRDVVSEGMLCSYQELGMTEPSEGIIELPEDAPLGQNIREYWDLDDVIIELNITPNRGDCLSILGIAREVAALTHSSIQESPLKPITETIADNKKIDILDSNGCGSYYSRIIRNVNAHLPAPRWLSERVKRSGTRSISSVVDVTNYVLYELGQPLHAFDLDKLQGNVCVRLAENNESIELLDGQTVTLKSGTLIIADEGGPIAMAGIMGGLRTAVTENTKNIFLESAWFNPLAIAGKARQYGISTDAAYRYERGVDPTIQQKALTRATHLIMEICGGNAGPEITVQTHYVPTQPVVLLRLRAIERLLGISFTENEEKDLEQSFQSLGLTILSKKLETWEIQIPPHRSDLSVEADLIEEAARIYGYQRIPASPVKTTLQANTQLANKIHSEKFCEILQARGYQEIISYSFVNANKQSLLYPESASLSLLNPISAEYADMRKGLWPGLLEAASYNQNRQITGMRLFETGTRFIMNNEKSSDSKNTIVQEKKIIAGLCVGERSILHWNEPTRTYDFYDIKGDVESLLTLSHTHSSYLFEAAQHPALHPGQSAEIIIGEKTLGWVGALHPELTKHWSLIGNVFLFELDLDYLSENCVPTYQKLSKFPSIRRDISFTIEASITAQAVIDCITSQDTTILKNAQIFDVYQGAHIAENQKSIAVALTLQHPERTLVESEVNELIEKVVNQLQHTFSIVLRQ